MPYAENTKYTIPTCLAPVVGGAALRRAPFFVRMRFAFELTPLGRAGAALNFEVVRV